MAYLACATLCSVIDNKQACAQAMGDNVVELILEFSDALSRGEHNSSEEVKMVFWDFLGLVMVSAHCSFLRFHILAVATLTYTDSDI